MAVNVYGIIAVIVFYLFILIIGIVAAKKVKSSEKRANSQQVMLAGRNIGLVVGIFTMTATWVSGGYINGTAEAVYSAVQHNGGGLVMTQVPVGYSLSLIIAGLFYAKKMREAQYVTMLDPLQNKFGKRMGGLLYLPALCGELFWNASLLAALGTTLSVIIDLEVWLSVLLSAAVAILYTVIGGLYSVAYTDVAQLVCILVGLTIAVPFAMNFEQTRPLSESVHDDHGAWLGYVSGTTWGPFIDVYLLLIFGGIPWQEYFQRVLASPTPQIAQLLSFVAAFGCLVCAIPPTLLGAIGYSTDWNQTLNGTGYTGPIPPESRLILPMVLQYLTPTAVSFIGLGSVSAAVMSSADSTMLGASTMFSKNIYANLFRPKASEREVIWVMRVSTVIFGIVAILMAISVTSIYGLSLLSGDLVYVMLFPQLTGALFIPKVNTYGSFSGFVVSLILRILSGEPYIGLTAALKFPWYDEANNTQNFPVRTFCMLIGFALLVGVSYLTNWLFQSGRIDNKFDILKCATDRKSSSSRNAGQELVQEHRKISVRENPE